MNVPRRVASFTPWSGLGNCTATYDPLTGIIIVAQIASSIGPSQLTWRVQRWLADGTAVTGVTTTVVPGYSSVGGSRAVRNLNAMQGHIGLNTETWVQLDAADIPQLGASGTSPASGASSNLYIEPYIFGLFLTGTTKIRRYLATGGVPAGAPATGEFDLGVAHSLDTISLGNSDDGFLYVRYQTSVIDGNGLFSQRLIKLDTALNVIHDWNVSTDITSTQLRYGANAGNFFVWNNLICFEGNFPPPHNISIALVKINPDFSLSDYGVRMPAVVTSTQSFTILLGSCIGLDGAGTFSLCEEKPIVWQSP